MRHSLWTLIGDYLFRHHSFKRFKADVRVENFNRKFARKAVRLQFQPWTPQTEPTFRHSGNAGDIIYSLPAVRALCHGAKARILLRAGIPAFYADGAHPSGNVRLSTETVKMLLPLLGAQPYIESCEAWTGQPFCHDLDAVQDSPIRLDRGHIARWYFALFGLAADLGQPWLVAPRDTAFSEHLVLARSGRYRNPVLSYSFLRRYPKIGFVGVESEYREMLQEVPGLEWFPVGDFLELATVINSARAFVGNQSFPFSLAEGLKVRRVLEVCPRAPNVIVEGDHAYDAYFQPQFEHMVARCVG